MQTAFDVIKILNDGKFHSGEQLAQNLRVSRTTIWKAIQYLKTLGLSINAVRARGYRLSKPLELLERSKILKSVPHEILPSLHRFEVLQSVTSTNDYLMDQIPYGLKPTSVCISEAQTKGKGRQGKVWMSPYGQNIYLSIYRKYAHSLRELSGLSLAIGITIIKTIREMYDLPDNLGIKWPNDIYFNQHKLGGILIETQFDHQTQQTDVITGIGLNLEGVDNITSGWIGLNSLLKRPIDRNHLCGKLLTELLKTFTKFENQGFSAFSKLWPELDLLSGKMVDVTIGEKKELGNCLGVNERGELLVQVGETLKALTYGEVSIRHSSEFID